MNPDTQKELLSRLDALGAKLGVAADHLWQIYLRQAYVEGVVNAITAGILFVLFFICVFFFNRGLRRAIKSNWESEGYIGLFISSGFVGAIFFGLGCSYVEDALIQLLNPSYWAFNHIMSTIR